MLKKQIKRKMRHKRTRAKVRGTAKVPRLCIFRSSQHIYAQLIDDEKGKTLVQAKDFEVTIKPSAKKKVASKFHDREKMKPSKKVDKKEEVVRLGKVAIAYEVGKLIAKKALEKKIKKVVFDRSGYKYHGRVKAIADGAREAGLSF